MTGLPAPGKRHVRIRDVQLAVSLQFNLSLAQMLSKDRHRVLARPRQAAVWMARQLTSKSYPIIARAFGYRDHTTALHACRTVDRVMAQDPAFSEEVFEACARARFIAHQRRSNV